MGENFDRLLAKLARIEVFVPRHTRIRNGRRQDVESYFRTIEIDAAGNPLGRVTPEEAAALEQSRETDVSHPARIEESLNDPPYSDFGKVYGGNRAAYVTPEGPVWMFRKGQRVRFYNSGGRQIGPEQENVAPAVAYAASQGWRMPPTPSQSDRPIGRSVMYRMPSGTTQSINVEGSTAAEAEANARRAIPPEAEIIRPAPDARNDINVTALERELRSLRATKVPDVGDPDELEEFEEERFQRIRQLERLLGRR